MTEEHKSAARRAVDPNLAAQLDALVAGRHADPFSLLGPHPLSTPDGNRWVIRFFRPGEPQDAAAAG